jgi:hypothetical protein
MRVDRVFGVVLWTGLDVPRVVLLALIALGVAIEEVREARKRRRPSSALVDALDLAARTSQVAFVTSDIP